MERGYLFADPDANGYTGVASTRLLDTHVGTGTGGKVAPVGANVALPLTIAGAAGIPTSGVTAVVLNVSVIGLVKGGYITAYPDGTPRPNTSDG